MRGLADTGAVGGSAVHMRVPQRIGRRLRVEQRDAEEGALAEGGQKLVPCAGPVELRCRDKVGFAGALVMGDEPLSGVILMEPRVLFVTS